MNGKIKKIIGLLDIKILFAMISFLLASCAKTHCVNPEQVEYIKFGYLQKGIDTFKAMSSWKEVVGHDERIDTVIVNRQFIQEYVELLNSTLENADTSSCDFRVVSLIKLKDGSEHYVCLGERYGLMFDSIVLQDNECVFSLIDSVLYTKEKWRKFHEMNMECFCSESYLQSKQFDTDFDSLYQNYLLKEDYSGYSIAIGVLLEKMRME